MKEFSRLLNSYNYKKEYATVRLDDDDGLNINFIDKLNLVYKNSKKSEIFSLVNGRKAIIKNNKILISNKTIYKNIALGLARFNGNIYSSGTHKTIHTRFEVIYDESPGMYLLYSSEFCDSKRKFISTETYFESNLKDFLIGEFFKKPAV